MFSRFRRFLAPAPPRSDRLPEQRARRLYPWMRLNILSATFVGYGMFYLVRNNLSPVSKELGTALGYDKAMIGDILAITAIAYGFGKLFMGSVSDRSDARKFMSLGLFATAVCNFVFASVTSYHAHMVLWGLNGFIQGMGWGPCGRSIGHWFSLKERGTTFALWNISHNVGGGIAGYLAAYAAGRWGWQSAFYVPGIIASAGALYLFLSLRDTPQSVGLPPIEEFKNDYPPHQEGQALHEKELTNKELFIDNILLNRCLWLFAAANFFVYIVRYSMLDWGPFYLREMKQATLSDGGLAVLVVEFGGIPSTILVGWFSDKVGGRRGMVSLLCMIPILLAFAGILFNPPGRLVDRHVPPCRHRLLRLPPGHAPGRRRPRPDLQESSRCRGRIRRPLRLSRPHGPGQRLRLARPALRRNNQPTSRLERRPLRDPDLHGAVNRTAGVYVECTAEGVRVC